MAPHEKAFIRLCEGRFGQQQKGGCEIVSIASIAASLSDCHIHKVNSNAKFK